MKFGEGQTRGTGKPLPETRRARLAIAKLVDENTEKLQGWLDEIYAAQGPKAAWDCLVDVIEYNLPKLARTEHTGEGGGPVVHTIERKVIWPQKEH